MSCKLSWTTNEKLAAGKGATVQEFFASVDSRTLQIEVAPWGEGRLKVNGRQIAHIDDAKDRRQAFRKLEAIADQYLKGQISIVNGNRKPSMIPAVKAKLLEGKKGLGFPSFNKEPLLTKVLCVVEPDRWLPVLKYSAAADGKKEIAKLVFDLDLPPAAKTSWTIGRLATWSNDLLRSLVGNDIPDLQVATQFLAWAKNQPPMSRT